MNKGIIQEMRIMVVEQQMTKVMRMIIKTENDKDNKSEKKG